MADEYPRILYRGAEAAPFFTVDDGEAAIAAGWTIVPPPRYWHPSFVEPPPAPVAEPPVKKGRK